MVELDSREIVDVKANGLQVFTYCANALEMLTSTFMTSLLWIGGSGHSNYVPIFGTKPTNYQNSQNRLMFENYT